MSAGYLVGQTTNTTWEVYTRKHIFNPLEMEASNFSVEDSQKTENFAIPYYEDEGEIKEIHSPQMIMSKTKKYGSFISA